MLEHFRIFFALEIHITFGSVKENFQLHLVFEINQPKNNIRIFFVGQNIDNPLYYEPQDGKVWENRDFPQL